MIETYYAMQKDAPRRKPRGDWMQTYTGRAYWPTDPHPDDVDIIDIAHHLSMLCRYTGAVKRFYSVAEHSVHVSFLVSPKNALVALLHDATEAYINDLNRPVKHGIGLAGYRDIETRNWHAIAAKFRVPVEIPEEVIRADTDMLWHEQILLEPHPRQDWGMGTTPPDTLRPDLIKAWSWEEAKMNFLARYSWLLDNQGWL